MGATISCHPLPKSLLPTTAAVTSAIVAMLNTSITMPKRDILPSELVLLLLFVVVSAGRCP